MFKRVTSFCLVTILILWVLSILGCTKENKDITIGVSIAVMNAERWKKDVEYMEKYAKELSVSIDITMSNADPATQYEECKALIDKGIDVLIITPSNAKEAADIVKLAHESNVKVISYDRIVLYEPVDLVVTFDGYKVGELQGKQLIETVDKGNYLVLSGDENDYNSSIFLEGALRYIDPLAKSGDINILAKESVAKWSADGAKEIVQRVLKENDNKLDAILAPNDTVAKGCIEALAEVSLDGKVAITGMDANLEAVHRILDEKQDVTIFKDIRELAKTAIEQAVKLAKGQKTDNNSVLDTLSTTPVITLYVTPQLVTKENIDKVLINSGYYTRDEVYTK